jgi:ABC-2 type transport system permease protein
MNKFLAVVKREYIQRVRSKLFVVMTVLGPILLGVFTVVPTLLMAIKTGDTRIAILDQTDGTKLYPSIRDALMRSERGRDTSAKSELADTVNANSQERMEKTGKGLAGNFRVLPVNSQGRSLDDIKRELSGKVAKEELEGYLIIPADILKNSETKPIYYGRNLSDVITQSQIERAVNAAVRKQRLTAAGVSEEAIERLSKPVDLEVYGVNEKGEEGVRASGVAGFALPFIVAFLIYLTVLLYGQVILGAVVEEKETRIAEILFSSVRSLTLMLGKLIGVSLVALTQLGIWAVAFVALTAILDSWLKARGLEGIPFHLPLVFFIYFFLFFALGYFVYATLYVFVGSMVTNTQEGGQVAMPIIFMLMAGLYLAFPVMRSPNSSFAVWISMVPFFSPIVMVVRIVSQTPPLWQIALSLLIGVVTVVLLLWLASRIYRVGMLMYGKKASIPEVMRWVRQA